VTAGSYSLLGRHGPDDVVAWGDGGERTRRALLADVAGVANRLPPPTSGSHIALICADRYCFAVGLLAAWQRGHAVALPANGQPQTVGLVADRPEVLALLHDTAGARGDDLRNWLSDRPTGHASLLDPMDAGRLMATVWTSGSTGAPQPCAKTAAQLLGEAALWADHLPLPAGTPVLATVPPHHLYGLLFSVLAPLMGGWRFDRTTPLHAETAVGRLSAMRGALLVSIPAHWRSLAGQDAGALAPVAVGLSSTAPLHAATAQVLQDRHGLCPIEVFGSTETGGIATRRQRLDPRWVPLPAVRVAGADDGTARVLSPFVPGGGATAFACADLVEVHPDGTFDHLGRRDGVVKTGGIRVSLPEVEALLLATPGVADAAVIAVPSAQAARGHELWAAVVAPTLTAADLRASLLGNLEPTSLPRRFVHVERLPRTDTGKLPVHRVRGLFGPVRDLEVLEHSATEESLTMRLRVPENLMWFQGHFRDHPVLPGIVQVHELVVRPVRAARPTWAGLLRVQRLKFRRVIGPGDVVAVAIAFARPVGTADFTIVRHDEPCASGRLVFDAGVSHG